MQRPQLRNLSIVVVLLACASAANDNLNLRDFSSSGPLDLHLNLPKDFFQKSFERETTILRGTEESRQFFRSLWDFEHVLAQADREGFKAFQHGIPWKDYYSNPGDCGHCKAKVALRKNLSLVQNHIQNTHAPLAAYLKNVTAYFGIPSGLNSYTTPPGGVGFGYHFDPSDAFIIQVRGSKRWELCSLKLTDRMGFQNLTYNQYAPGHPDIGKCEIISLEEGDAIYLPIGAIHRAAANDGLSVHLTMALNRQFCSLAPMLMNVAQQINPSKEYGFLQPNISNWVYRVSASPIGDMAKMHLVPSSLLAQVPSTGGLPPSFLNPVFLNVTNSSETPGLPLKMVQDFMKNVAEGVMLLAGHPNATNEVLSLTVRMTNETDAVEKKLRPSAVLEGLGPLINTERAGRALLSWRKFFREELEKLNEVLRLNPNILLDWQLNDENYTEEAIFSGGIEDSDDSTETLLEDERSTTPGDSRCTDSVSDGNSCEDHPEIGATILYPADDALAQGDDKNSDDDSCTNSHSCQGDLNSGDSCNNSKNDRQEPVPRRELSGEDGNGDEDEDEDEDGVAFAQALEPHCCESEDAASQLSCANETAVALNPDEKVVVEDETSVLIVTYATAQVHDFARYSLPVNALWARRHRHRFVVDQRGLATNGADAKNAKVLVKQYWVSHPDVRDNWVLWVGADAIFVNFDDKGEDVLRRLIREHAAGTDVQVLVTRDPHGRAGNSLSLFNADVILLRRSEWSSKFLQRWWDDPRMKEGRTDQEVLELLYLEDVMGAKSKFVLLPPLTLNSDTLSIVEKPPNQQPVVHLGGHSDGVRKAVFQHALTSLCGKLTGGHGATAAVASPFSPVTDLPDLDLKEVYINALQAEVDSPPNAALSSGHFHSSTMSGAFQRLAWHLSDQGRSSESIEVQRKALRWAKEKLGPKHRDALQAAVALAGTLRTQGGAVFLQESEKLHRWALAGMTEVAGKADRDTLAIGNSLGLVLEAQGKLQEAEQQYRISYEGLLEVVGPSAGSTLSAGFNLASTLMKRALMRDAEASGRDWKAVVAEAESVHRAVLRGKEATYGRESAEAMESIDALVQLLVSQFGASKAPEAEALQRRSLTWRLARAGSEADDASFHRGVVQARSALAQSLRMQGKLDVALEEFELAYLACRDSPELGGQEGVNTFAAATNYAAVLQELNRAEESLELLKGAVEGLTKVLGPDHPNTKGAMMLYTRSLSQIKKK